MENEKYVWYVCYGSNLAIERLYCYFNGRSSERVHIKKGYLCPFCPNPNFENRPYDLPYSIYFANTAGCSSNWGNTGVAFLDDQKPGFAYGRAYKMSKECYEWLHRKEGTGDDWYNKEISLGHMDDGCEILTFTNIKRLLDKEPCNDYFDVIKTGLLEMGVEESKINEYFANLLQQQK